ncbi:unnamed protein product, partial [Mesorhabditis belari]|uniref:Beta-catenin-like protein 1 n=1 Tax=Mesorhabditis belari TaxID=2138241 RepID=A0AAF3ET67_9BILA
MAEIDVSEILRAAIEPERKRARLEQPEQNGNGAAVMPSLSTGARQEEILAALEDDSAQAQIVDEALVKKLTGQLEKKQQKNREMRIKHGDDPKKFMDSEIELDTGVQEMHVIATNPEFYGLLVELGAIQIFVQLLAHENGDIVGATLNLLQELTDVDILNESSEGADSLVDALLSARIVECIVSGFAALNEANKDDADALHNGLNIFENILEFRPEFSDDCVTQGLFQWLLKRATQRGTFDGNKMYASELLALLLQTNESAREELTKKIDGMELLLRALAAYKRHDPGSLDETEHMENLFDALCSSLLYSPNRKNFLEGEGLQLMNLMLRERKQSRESALKVLDHATTGPEGQENCAKFIEILGLRTLFPLFLRTPTKVKRKDTTPNEHEEHVCAILAALMRSCDEDARQRIMQKFVEHEHEKMDRAVELFLKYRERVDKFLARRKREQANSEEEIDNDREYFDLLDGGLYTLQNITLLLADICAHTNSARQRAIKLFNMKTKQEILSKHLIPVLSKYAENLGEQADEERNRVDLFIARLNAAENAERQQ